MTTPYRLGVAESAQEIRNGALSPVTLAESLLGRIDALEPSLQAWVTIDREQVLSAARGREQEAEQGRIRGPLHGVPVGIKDIFYTEGMATTACSRILADFVPDFDAPCVAKLKEAGAIVLGKAVTTEFAASDPPPTLNAWNPAHTPGRLQQRVVRGGLDRHVRSGVGLPDRRVCLPPRFVQRDSRPEAQLRSNQPPRRGGL